ncbi:MAG TPA: hypothetical protein VF479_09685 [Pseudolysinimonas sp.]
MATVSRSRRAASGIAFIVAGALVALAAILPLLNVSVSWMWVLAYAALAVAFGILGFGAVNNTVAKICLIAAMVGWGLLALVGLGLGLPGVIATIAAILAGLGGLIGAIVLYVGKEITNMAAVAFIVATALGLIVLLGSPLGVFSLGSTLALIVVLLFAAALIVTGVLFRRPEGRR